MKMKKSEEINKEIHFLNQSSLVFFSLFRTIGVDDAEMNRRLLMSCSQAESTTAFVSNFSTKLLESKNNKATHAPRELSESRSQPKRV